jgi:RHS repeat-associated protein
VFISVHSWFFNCMDTAYSVRRVAVSAEGSPKCHSAPSGNTVARSWKSCEDIRRTTPKLMRPSSQFTCRRRGDETLTGPDRSVLKPSQERTGGNIPLVSYTRGNDLSGSLEGLPRERSPLVPSIRLPGHKAGEHYSKVATVANLSRGKGGIGGLLARSDGYSTGTGNWSTNNYYFADGNGNITHLVNAAQTLAASYRYDPFGNLISSSGTLASANVYRFSSKEFMVNSGMYYYLYRFYDPNLQRWINKDPIGEIGGMNAYGFLANSPLNRVDSLGWLPGEPSGLEFPDFDEPYSWPGSGRTLPGRTRARPGLAGDAGDYANYDPGHIGEELDPMEEANEAATGCPYGCPIGGCHHHIGPATAPPPPPTLPPREPPFFLPPPLSLPPDPGAHLAWPTATSLPPTAPPTPGPFCSTCNVNRPRL